MALSVDDLKTYVILTVEAHTVPEHKENGLEAGKLENKYGHPSNTLHVSDGHGEYWFERWYKEPDGTWTIPRQKTTWKGCYRGLCAPIRKIEAIMEDSQIFINTQFHNCEERYIWYKFQKDGFYVHEGSPYHGKFLQAAFTREGKRMVERINAKDGYAFVDLDEDVEIPWHYTDAFKEIVERNRYF